MNKSATQSGTLRSAPPPDDLSPFVTGFAFRSERVDAAVVRLLPELRSSVQLHVGDPYWVRERRAGATWQRCPRLALWAPRPDWSYGYAAGRVRACGFGLTPAGLRAIRRGRSAIARNTIMDLREHPVLGSIATLGYETDFARWTERTCEVLRVLFDGIDPVPDIPDAAMNRLVTDGTGAVAAAAATMGLSSRQFRRRFKASYGVGPKTYQRLLRVDRMLRQLHPQPWEPDAYGDLPVPFSDQSHAIREFKQATGVTPSMYVAQKRVGDRTLRSLPAGRDIRPPRGVRTDDAHR